MSVLRDAGTIFRYQLRLLIREPVWFVIALVQPLLYLALFAPLLAGAVLSFGSPEYFMLMVLAFSNDIGRILGG